jgi:lysyl-tRNA synthetase class 2
MTLVRDMFRYIAKEVYGKTTFEKDGMKYDLADDWEEIDYVEIIRDKLGIDIFDVSNDDMINVLKEKGAFIPEIPNRNRLVDALWKILRKDIVGPAFLINEPKFMSPLAKSKKDNEDITERFHVILAGSELGNGYSELNDPFDQFRRFKEQQAAREAGDAEAQMLDIDYVEMLEYGMPPTSGYGHSERLFWFLENITAREGTLFPQMKYYLDETTRKLYNL